nr:TonB-dependent receptor [uncultured Chitinophaga sp.]
MQFLITKFVLLFYLIQILVKRSTFLLFMKLTALLLVIACLQSRASTGQVITIKVKNAKLSEVFSRIQQQSGYFFFYNETHIQNARPVTADINNQSLKTALDICFAGQPLTYKIVNKMIVVGEAPALPFSPTIHNVTPPARISGKVTDSVGRPVIGATVFIKGTKTGTVTKDDGTFFLESPEPAGILIISSIGFKQREIAFSGSNYLQVILAVSENKLEDLVVVAYGKQRKTTLTGSVAQISGVEIAKAPVANVINGLQGRLPGLTFRQGGGQPGDDVAKFNIRGFGSPLTIVDGVPSDIAQIDPNEIESFTILKDGAAAMYGFKGANGAILITTRRGKTGEPVVALNAYTGIQGITRYPRLMNAGEFTELMDEASVNAGNAPIYGAKEVQKWKMGVDSGYKSTDWYNEVFRKWATMNNVNLNIQGGTEKVKYFVSGGMLDQQGLLRSGDVKFRRYNFRSNISMQINKRLTAELNLGGRKENRFSPNAPIPGTDAINIVNVIQRSYPITPVYANNDPNYFAVTNVQVNPAAMAQAAYSGYNNSVWDVFTGIGTLTYSIPYIEGLNARLSFNYESNNNRYSTWSKQYLLYSYDPTTKKYTPTYTGNAPSTLKQGYSQGGTTSNVQLSLNYDHTFNGAHHFTGLLLLERRKTNSTGIQGSKQFTVDAIPNLDLGNAANQTTGTYQLGQSAYQGYVGRINYDYKAKYLLELGGRYDYSYKFLNGAFFPEISAGWVINKEPFFNFAFLSNLKLRASWAKVADDGSFDEFKYLSGYNYPSGNYIFSGSTVVNGLQVGTLANPRLSWQTANIFNAALDFGLFDNTITGTFEVFYRNVTGIPAYPASSFPSIAAIPVAQQNLNSTNNRGFELELGYYKRIGDFVLNVSPNISWTRGRNAYIEQPPYGSASENYLNNTAYRWQNRLTGYHAIGQFQSQEEINRSPVQDSRGNATLHPGDIKYEDINGDGVIDSRDQTVIGRGDYPELQYGLALNASYKGIDVSLLFAGAGNFNVNYNGVLQNPFWNNANSYAYFTDRWHREDIYDPNSPWVPGKFPATIISGNPNNRLTSSFWLQKGTYLRLKTVQIGYAIPKKILAKSGIKSLRFFASGQNIFTITGVKYLDPEVGDAEAAYYPQQRTFVFGINAKF